jgi:hypothetical protein
VLEAAMKAKFKHRRGQCLFFYDLPVKIMWRCIETPPEADPMYYVIDKHNSPHHAFESELFKRATKYNPRRRNPHET